jgi:hypothetical protein
MPDEEIIGWIRPGVQYFSEESRRTVDFSESSEISSQEAGHSPILRYDWRRRRHGADDDQNKEPTMTTNPIELANSFTKGGTKLEIAVEGALNQVEIWCDKAENAHHPIQRDNYNRLADLYGKAALILLKRLGKKQRRASRIAP